jgi:flagellar motor switch protein FliN/FliY
MAKASTPSGPSAADPAERGDRPEDAAGEAGEPLLSPDSSLFRDVLVTLQARLGTVSMPLADLLALRAGEVLTLDRQMNEPVELFLNDRLVARGEIVSVGDSFAVRIVEVAAQ